MRKECVRARETNIGKDKKGTKKRIASNSSGVSVVPFTLLSTRQTEGEPPFPLNSTVS